MDRARLEAFIRRERVFGIIHRVGTPARWPLCCLPPGPPVVLGVHLLGVYDRLIAAGARDWRVPCRGVCTASTVPIGLRDASQATRGVRLYARPSATLWSASSSSLALSTVREASTRAPPLTRRLVWQPTFPQRSCGRCGSSRQRTSSTRISARSCAETDPRVAAVWDELLLERARDAAAT